MRPPQGVQSVLVLESEALCGAPKLPSSHKGGRWRSEVQKKEGRGFPCQENGAKSTAVTFLGGCGRRGVLY